MRWLIGWRRGGKTDGLLVLCASSHAGIATSDSCTKRLASAGQGYLLLVRSRGCGGGEEETGLILCTCMYCTNTVLVLYLQGQGSYD